MLYESSDQSNQRAPLHAPHYSQNSFGTQGLAPRSQDFVGVGYKHYGYEAQGSSPFDFTRAEMWAFLEGRTPGGRQYEKLTVTLILVNVVAFILGTLFDTEYNVNPNTGAYVGPERVWLDVLLFGTENSVYGGVSVLELVTVIVFTVDYVLRFWACTEDKQYKNRWTYVTSFFALVDLASILPTYMNICMPHDIAGTQFLRMFRLFRMMKMEGRYAESFTLFDDVIANKKHVLVTAGFVGAVVWVIDAGFYYIVAKGSVNMIYCPTCPDVDVAKCTFGALGSVDCSKAGCPKAASCWNLYESIPASMFQTLMNLFGEFPLADRYTGWGMVIAGLNAVVASVVFGIPTGIIGSGFQELLEKKRKEKEASERTALTVQTAPGYGAAEAPAPLTAPIRGSDTMRGRIYNFLFVVNSRAAIAFEYVTVALIILSTLTFMAQTCTFIETSPKLGWLCNFFEVVTVGVFTCEYLLRAYSVGEDPRFAGAGGLWKHLLSFDAIIDLFSIAPFYIGLGFTKNASMTIFIRSLRLIRVVRTQKFKAAFRVLKGVILAQSDILIITGFAALVFWIFFSSIMYYAERSNPDKEVAAAYTTIPQAMWVTLLNLSGEVPLVMYTTTGKVFIGIIGLFAVGIIAIPIGVLAAGFQDYVDDEEPEASPPPPENMQAAPSLHAQAHPDQKEHAAIVSFLEGETTSGKYFEALILLLIFVSVGLAIVQTVPGQQCDGADSGGKWCPLYAVLETFSVAVFTVEYLLRLHAAPSKFDFVFSFYSLVDLVAIVPFYIAACNPGGWIDRHNEIFLMLRIMRLVKLDKYCPSLTLIDDVFRLKWTSLSVSGAIAAILLVIFNSLMFLAEFNDTADAIDPIPLQGCSGNCTQSMRYSSAFASLPFVMIHLTGDYPIMDYNIFGRVVCFFMVVFAAGVVGIPTGIIADGFREVVSKRGGATSALREYDVQLTQIGDVPPRELTSDKLDRLQGDVNTLLNGSRTSNGEVKRSVCSTVLRYTILALIILNVFVTLLETVPSVASHRDTLVWFQAFEVIVVLFFTVEYILRMFSVTKDKLHLYSRWCYATTFFGVVDLITILPFYVELLLIPFGLDSAKASDIFRLIRLFRLLELEHFVTAFTVLDNVFVRARGTLAATGILAFCIWISASALFYMFEHDNPNWCTAWVDPACTTAWKPTCTCASPSTFDTMPHAMFYTAIFIAGEWAIVDFTVPGKFLCIALCVVGIALAALPVGILFDSFGAVLEEGLSSLDEEEEEDQKDPAASTESRIRPIGTLGMPPPVFSWRSPPRAGSTETGDGSPWRPLSSTTDAGPGASGLWRPTGSAV